MPDGPAGVADDRIGMPDDRADVADDPVRTPDDRVELADDPAGTRDDRGDAADGRTGMKDDRAALPSAPRRPVSRRRRLVGLASPLQPGCVMRTRILVALALAPLASAAFVACGGSPDDGAIRPPTYDASPTPPPYGYEAGTPARDAGSAADAAADAGPPIPPIAAAASAPAAACPDGNAPTVYVLAQDATLFTLDLATLTMKSMGPLACPDRSAPSSLTVSPDGTAYVLYGGQGDVYAVDLATLACRRTAVAPLPRVAGQAGGASSIALGAGRAGDRLYQLAPQPTPTLHVADTASHLFTVGSFPGTGYATPSAITVDAYGRMFAVGPDGTIDQLDPATGAIVGQDVTGLDASSELEYALSLMAWGDQLYVFVGTSGALTRYDPATKTLHPLGQVNQIVAGASAAACAPAASIQPGDAGASDGGAAPGDAGGSAPQAIPFAPGDAWIGTFACAPGLTSVALLVDSVDGATIHARVDFDWGASGNGASYAVDGAYDPATREARFTPGAWAFGASSSFSAVGLDGYVDLAGGRLAGNVTQAGCGAFSLAR